MQTFKRLSNGPRENVPTEIPTRLMSRKDERICNGDLEWRTSRNVSSTRHEIKWVRSAELQSCNWFVFSRCWQCLLKIFLSGAFKSHSKWRSAYRRHQHHAEYLCHYLCVPFDSRLTSPKLQAIRIGLRRNRVCCWFPVQKRVQSCHELLQHPVCMHWSPGGSLSVTSRLMYIYIGHPTLQGSVSWRQIRYILSCAPIWKNSPSSKFLHRFWKKNQLDTILMWNSISAWFLPLWVCYRVSFARRLDASLNFHSRLPGIGSSFDGLENSQNT
jgi:hypothetical protein